MNSLLGFAAHMKETNDAQKHEDHYSCSCLAEQHPVNRACRTCVRKSRAILSSLVMILLETQGGYHPSCFPTLDILS